MTASVGELSGGFYVADTGPGIPEDDREEVFEAGCSTSDHGTGFGLRIVEEIADAHGWTVSVTERDTVDHKFVEEFATPGCRISPSSHSRQYQDVTLTATLPHNASESYP